MKRRKIGRKTAKARVKASRRNAPKGVRVRTPAAEDTQIARVARERDEALHQQAATAEILKLISSSPADTQPVFDAIVRSGLKLFPDAAIFIAVPDGDKLRAAAFAATDPDLAKMWARQWPVPLTREYMHSLAFLDRKTVDIPDAREAPPELATGAKNFLPTGYRALTIMPMMRGRTAIGTLSVVRLAPGKLSDRQLAALKTYAAQAVIAIENTRVLNELRQRTDDLSESLEQQTATSAVLKVISSTPGELEPVFEAMLENAVRICEAKFGVLFRHEDGKFRQAATLNVSTAHANSLRQRDRFVPEPGVPLDRLLKTKKIIHTLDEAASANPAPAARLSGARSHIAVPMVKDDELVGAIVIYRQEVRPFTDKQIELVKNFAAQAVIAIENTRLLNELRQRTDDLSESLEQQTATSEVLKVISSSPGELEPVFNSILANATHLCEATFGNLFLREGLVFRAVAVHGKESYVDYWRRDPVIDLREVPGVPLDRAVKSKQVVHVPDLRIDPSYTERNDRIVALVEIAGARSFVMVPMLKEGEIIGTVAMYRQEVRPFTEKQIELLKNFAAQAVIAIENTRLLNELRQRTDDLSESLEQQTATSEVLKIISSSPGQLEPVFNAMLENAVQICAAKFGSMILFEGDLYRRAALFNAPAAFLEQQAKNPVRPMSDSPTLTRVAKAKKSVQVADMLVEHPEEAIAKFGGARTVLCVPMLRDGRVVGVFSIYRQEVRSFTDKQTDLVKNFAAQAVIAIENARLLNELRQRTDDLSESLEQQTATSAVLKVISSTPGELEPVFEAILENATRICEAQFGVLFRTEGDAVRCVAMHGAPKPYVEERRRNPVIRPDPATMFGRALATKQPTQIADIRDEIRSSGVPSGYTGTQLANLAGARTVLAVPMLKDDEVVGAILIYRQQVRPFTDKQTELLVNFAAQAVIAIENTRLLNELRESLQQQTATADVLKIISRSTFDLQKVLDTLTEFSSSPLRGVQFGYFIAPRPIARR